MRLSSNPHRKDAWSNVESPEIARAWIEVSPNLKDTYSSILHIVWKYWIKVVLQIFMEAVSKKALSFDIFKVHIFWEGHRRFVLCINGRIYSGDFSKFCGLLRIYELYVHTARQKLLLLTFWLQSQKYFCHAQILFHLTYFLRKNEFI